MKNHSKADFPFLFAIFALIIPQKICISRRNSNGGPMKGITHLTSLRILKPIKAIQEKKYTGFVNIRPLALCISDMSCPLKGQMIRSIGDAIYSYQKDILCQCLKWGCENYLYKDYHLKSGIRS
jgi:hypothetical protein